MSVLGRRLAAGWEAAWYSPADPVGVIAARTILALHALWLALSRPALPDILSWPAELWSGVDPWLLRRFAILGLPVAVEQALYLVMIAALVATAAGIVPRLAGLTAALLVYHFAPLEDILAGTGGPFFRGFTLAVSGLVVLSVAERPRRDAPPSPEFRWPLVIVQILFACTYVLSGVSKLVSVGPAWASAQNFEGLVLGMVMPETRPVLAHLFVDQPLLCAAGGLAGLAMDFGVAAAVLVPGAWRIVVPAVAVTHVLIYFVMGVFFPGAPLLLLLVDWPRVLGRSHGRTVDAPRTA